MADQGTTAPAAKPARSTLTDFRYWINYHNSFDTAQIEAAKFDGRVPHPDIVRRVEIADDFLTLLFKLDKCRESITGVFRRYGLL